MSRDPENEASLERAPTPLEQAALGWVVRSERGLDVEQERELANWLAANPRHGELFMEFGGVWKVMGQFKDASDAGATHSQPLAGTEIPFEGTVGLEGTAGRRARTPWLALAAAAAIVLAAVNWWPPSHEGAAIATEIGSSRQLKLSDGSLVELNTDSALVADFTSAQRRVRLTKGEAYFQVAKDAARPFVVEAAGVGVRAIGTAFNVRHHSASVEVLVTEGKVRVSPALGAGATSAPTTQPAGAGGRRGEGADVSAGERIFVSVAPRAAPAPALEVARVPADEMQRRLAWQDRRLDFSDTTLGEMVAEFNRYNRHKLAVPDPALASMRFGGSFRPDDRAGFVRVLRENFRIVAEERSDLTLLHAAR